MLNKNNEKKNKKRWSTWGRLLVSVWCEPVKVFADQNKHFQQVAGKQLQAGTGNGTGVTDVA